MNTWAYNYFYKTTLIPTGQFYYGIHSTNNINDGYLGSGVRLRKLFDQYKKSDFSKEIIKYFNSRKELSDYEREYITFDILNDPLCLNVSLGGDLHDNIGVTKGLVTVKDKDGNIFDTSINDPRYLSGELIPPTRGTVSVRDKSGKVIKVPVNDPRYLSGELVIITKGNKGMTGRTMVKKDGIQKSILLSELEDYIKNGWVRGNLDKGRTSPTKGRIWIYKDDRQLCVLSSELEKYINEGWTKGRICKSIKDRVSITKDNKNKYVEIYELGKYLQEGWRLGATSRNKGKVTVTEDGINWFDVENDDERFKSGKLKCLFQIKNVTKGLKYIHKDGKIKRVRPEYVDKFLQDGWILGMGSKSKKEKQNN